MTRLSKLYNAWYLTTTPQIDGKLVESNSHCRTQQCSCSQRRTQPAILQQKPQKRSKMYQINRPKEPKMLVRKGSGRERSLCLRRLLSLADADALGPAGFPFPAALPLAAAGGFFLFSAAPAAASSLELSMARWWDRIGQGARVWGFGRLGTKLESARRGLKV
jgi:hypothetical protein